MRVSAAIVLAAALSAAGPAPPALADELPAGASWSQHRLESSDGTKLHADVFRPQGEAIGRTPVMLVVSPYLGTPTASDPGPPKVLAWYRRLYERAIARRYTVVQVSLRGTGASHGCEDFGGPGDQGDALAAVRWSATRPWSDGRVGMLGHSFDGYTALVAAAARPAGLRAAVVTAPPIALYRGVFMNGVGYVQRPVVAPYYQAFALFPPRDPTLTADVLGGRDFSCSPEVAASGQDPDPSTAFWHERNLVDRLAGTRLPVLWAHGFLDGRDDYSAVRPDNFLDVWERLRGPRRAWFGQFPHLVPGELNTWNEEEPIGRRGFADEALDWLDAYVKGERRARSRLRPWRSVAVQDGAAGLWRHEPLWPPLGAREATLPLVGGSYVDGPGNKAEQGEGPSGECEGVHARCNPLSRTGQGTWTFSQSLRSAVRVAGAGELRASLDAPAPGARVIALVYDVDPDGQATLLTRGASLIGAGGEVDFALYPQDWRVARGHRIAVLLAGSDDFYFEPGTTATTVRVEGGSLALPVVWARPAASFGEPSRSVRERTSFEVDRGSSENRTQWMRLPALRPPRLTVRTRQRRVGAGRLRMRVRVLGPGQVPIPGARVVAGRSRARTGWNGVARLVLPARRARWLRVSSPGYRDRPVRLGRADRR